MWRILNSPIAIATLILISLFSYDQLKKNRAASEIRAVYTELISITEDAKDDLERKKLIEGFVKEAGEQIRDGFEFFSNEEGKRKKAEENKLYFETKKLVVISSPKIIENKQFSKTQKIIVYQVKNTSQEHLGKIAHTIELYNKKELVYVKEEWGQVKLAPGESMSHSFNAGNNEIVFDDVKIKIYNISIIDVAT